MDFVIKFSIIYIKFSYFLLLKVRVKSGYEGAFTFALLQAFD